MSCDYCSSESEVKNEVLSQLHVSTRAEEFLKLLGRWRLPVTKCMSIMILGISYKDHWGIHYAKWSTSCVGKLTHEFNKHSVNANYHTQHILPVCFTIFIVLHLIKEAKNTRELHFCGLDIYRSCFIILEFHCMIQYCSVMGL